MAVIAKCDFCGETKPLEAEMGTAKLPNDWFVSFTVDMEAKRMKEIDVCSEACAQGYDTESGMKRTVVKTLEGLEQVTREFDLNDKESMN